MRVGKWHLTKSYSSRLIIDEQNRVLWRMGWGQTAAGVVANFKWLQRVHTIIPTPQAFSLRRFGPLVLSSESYVLGMPLTPDDITLARTEEIIRALVPLYKIGQIHGDLTHRNILSGSAGLFFIDGDRATYAPPEFDVWLLLADAAIHRDGAASHKKFLQLLWQSSPYDEPYRTATRALYSLMPPLAANEAEWPRLWASFLARCLSHSVRDCRRRGKSLDFLDGLS